MAGREPAGEAGRRGELLGDSSAEAATTIEGPLILSSWGPDLDDALVGVAVQAQHKRCWSLRTEAPPGLQARQRPCASTAGGSGDGSGRPVHSGL